MRKSVLLAVLAAATVVSVIPTDAATNTASSGSGMGVKMKDGAKAVGRGVMWGPKKVGNGFKKMGEKMHGSKKSGSGSK